MPELTVEGLSKNYGNVAALDHVSFRVKDGEFFTLLGPSGCGKSTTLASIAGLEVPDDGRILVGDRVLFDSNTGRYLYPEERDVGLVFQSYALWPHMTVRENLAFPLKLRRVPKPDQDGRIRETLRLVELEGYEGRYPHQLSGGQQQRVALARALVYSPSILLLDEPLSNLDAKLRERARVWLSRLRRELGITTVYVTHDQVEALALSDRIAVMDSGHIRQVGTPFEVYEQPVDPFVADFIGTTNFLEGQIVSTGEDGVLVALDGDGTPLRVRAASAYREGVRVTLAVRPERIELEPGFDRVLSGGNGRNASKGAASVHSRNTAPGRVVARTYLGARYQYHVEVGSSVLRVETGSAIDADRVGVRFPEESCAIFPSSHPLGRPLRQPMPEGAVGEL
ncbi:ABC transporter ATP-binding protein [Limnochorda pilosa]|uniref:ABC-type quaternary amine transporter n=1 Tax=Limnochorda pilosa TaxID=1555112 RepID=A0A0K2SP42_LIMPI|nr:ABC transporter ATP-binding protein [Limnochorda pilosa]BAS28594.1 ABC transporter ATP-binding protein [Limnochorda pilosa]